MNGWRLLRRLRGRFEPILLPVQPRIRRRLYWFSGDIRAGSLTQVN
jgi:hypothetical protein